MYERRERLQLKKSCVAGALLEARCQGSLLVAELIRVVGWLLAYSVLLDSIFQSVPRFSLFFLHLYINKSTACLMEKDLAGINTGGVHCWKSFRITLTCQVRRTYSNI
jgi:hypothetical protein